VIEFKAVHIGDLGWLLLLKTSVLQGVGLTGHALHLSMCVHRGYFPARSSQVYVVMVTIRFSQ
jgi:hypothetical protein